MHPQHLFLAQGTTCLLSSPGPALTQLCLLGRQTGLGRREEGSAGGRWCKEPTAGERHCTLTASEPAEQSHLDRTQLHATAVSSQLLFCTGAIMFAQDTTAIFLDMHRDI